MKQIKKLKWTEYPVNYGRKIWGARAYHELAFYIVETMNTGKFETYLGKIIKKNRLQSVESVEEGKIVCQNCFNSMVEECLEESN